MSSSSKRKREDDGAGEVDLALLEELGKSGEVVEAVDARAVRKMVLSFERRLKDNLEARMKYMDQPERFADSEIELDEELKRMHVLAASPQLYPELVRLNVVPSILSLLSHDNVDIAGDVVDLLKELTDSDAIAESEEPARMLVDALTQGNAPELLVHNLFRLNEQDADEAATVFDTLSIIENMIEVRPALVDTVGEKTKLLEWLLRRIRAPTVDSNKLYSSEILAILLQTSASNQRLVGELNGVDTILLVIAPYKSKNPKGDEEETLENFFDCLCSLVMHPDNKQKFVEAEGVELMVRIMQERKLAFASAVKTLDFALTKCPAACERFVEFRGLRSLFPAFMGKIPKQRTDSSLEEIEGRVISVLCSLFGGISQSSNRERLLSKFVENECEKLDRLMEFFVRYSNRVKSESKRLEEEELEDVELDEEERYLRKLDAGLFSLQLVALIIGHLSCSGIDAIQSRLSLLLKQQRLQSGHVKAILEEYLANLGDKDGAEERERWTSQVQKFITAM